MKNLSVFGKNVNPNNKVEINMDCEIKLTVNIQNLYKQEINTYHGVNRIVCNELKNYIVIESDQHFEVIALKDDKNNEVEIYVENESTPEFHYLTNIYPF